VNPLSLRDAIKRGQPGQAGVLNQLQGQTLVRLDFGHASDAGSFAITLLNVRFSGVFPLGGGPVAGTPLDNQAGMAAAAAGQGIPPPELAQYNMFGIWVRVKWGMGAATDNCYVSYPWGGATFIIHGSSFEVSIPPGLMNYQEPSTCQPFIGAFAAPCTGGVRSVRPPTLLVGTQALVIGTPAVFPAPPRSVGYRLYTANPVDDNAGGVANPSAAFIVRQLGWNNGQFTNFAIDTTNADVYRSGLSNVLETSIDLSTAQQRATRTPYDWTTLAPVAQAISVTQSNGPAVALGVEWVLDLG
jgi:hypothetical protein